MNNGVVELLNGHHTDSPVMETSRDNGAAIIRLSCVVKAYKAASPEMMALKGIDLSIQPGEFVAIVGKSGSGKSTLGNMITGIDRPTAGAIQINGTEISQLNEQQLTRWRGSSMGIIFQFFQLVPSLTAVENVMLPMDFAGKIPRARRQRVALDLLERVEMSDFATRFPTDVSGGQQQRIAIARALANDPSILVCDEPTGNLDSRTAAHVFSLFKTLIDEGKTIVMITHDDELAERTDRQIRIHDGRIVHDSRNSEPFHG